MKTVIYSGTADYFRVTEGTLLKRGEQTRLNNKLAHTALSHPKVEEHIEPNDETNEALLPREDDEEATDGSSELEGGDEKGNT